MAQAWGTITGYKSTTPKIHSGSGNFNILRVEEGIYLIDFNNGLFSKTPALSVTLQFSDNDKWNDFSSPGGSTLDNSTIIAIDNLHAKVKTGDLFGKARDYNFSFIAIGD